MNEAIMVIVVAACGAMGSGGSGCGVDIDHISFPTIEICQRASEMLFPVPEGLSRYEMEQLWQPRREVRCVPAI